MKPWMEYVNCEDTPYVLKGFAILEPEQITLVSVDTNRVFPIPISEGRVEENHLI